MIPTDPSGPIVAEALDFLGAVGDNTAQAAVLDPQWDTTGGREAASKGLGYFRAEPVPMSDMQVRGIVTELDRVVCDGWLIVWCDVHHLLRGSFHLWSSGTRWRLADMVVWRRPGLGLGSLVRRNAEVALLATNGSERRFRTHDVATIMDAPRPRTAHPHAKPIPLMTQILDAITDPDDLVVDPAAGSYSTLEACRATGRRFLGCDLREPQSWAHSTTASLWEST